MQPSRPKRVPGVRPFRRGVARGVVRAGVAVGAACAVTLALSGSAHADPEPSTKELKTQAEKLGDQLEQLTEQYNGSRVRIQQAQRAAKVATTNAVRQERQ